jgi:HSP20 family protein
MLYRPYRSRSLFQEMDRLQREMNRLFEGYTPSRVRSAPGYPAMNVYADENSALVTAEVPGVKSDDIDISVIDDTLTLTGVRNAVELSEGGKYHRRERGFGQFTRNIKLPYKVNVENVAATFKNGVLSIELPRAEADKPKKITVKTG